MTVVRSRVEHFVKPGRGRLGLGLRARAVTLEFDDGRSVVEFYVEGELVERKVIEPKVVEPGE